MAGRRLTREEAEVLQDFVASQERIQQATRRAARHTNDPDVLRELADIQHASRTAVGYLTKWLLGLVGVGVAIALIYLL